MEKIINFDMDGTIADFYGVEGWLDDLYNGNTRPYEIAKPLVNMQVLARLINRLQTKGYTINIISYVSRKADKDFSDRIKQAKLKWLHTHLKSVCFDNIFIVAHGVPKHSLASGILFDDEEGNRKAWNNGIAYGVDNIINILKSLTNS